MEAEALFERRLSLFLFRVGSDQSCVQIHDKRILRVGAVVGGIGSGQSPCAASGRGAGGVDGLQSSGGVLREGVDGPRDRRIAGHQSVDPRLGTQQCDVGQAVPAEGECDGEVGDDLRRVVDRERLAPRGQRRRQFAPDPGHGDRLGQQHPAGLTHRPRRGRVDLQARIRTGSIRHSEGAPRTGANWSSTDRILPGQEHFSVERHGLKPLGYESARLDPIVRDMLALGSRALVFARGIYDEDGSIEFLLRRRCLGIYRYSFETGTIDRADYDLVHPRWESGLAFAGSPDGERVAIVEGWQPGAPGFENLGAVRLTLLVTGFTPGTRRVLLELNAGGSGSADDVSRQWSPDGTRIAPWRSPCSAHGRTFPSSGRHSSSSTSRPEGRSSAPMTSASPVRRPGVRTATTSWSL